MRNHIHGLCLSWRDCRDGVTAVEFSLLAFPFMLFVIGIIELALMFAAETVMNGAVTDAARLIRTGQAQQAEEGPETMFRDALCDGAGIMLDCDNLQYQVQRIDNFAAADMMPEFDEEGNLQDTIFDAGDVSDVVMIRVAYLYPLLTPGMATFFANYPGDRKLMMATIVLQAEPYDFEDGG